MRKRRVPTGLIIPALLVGLVGLLATLQYEWLGKVSEAEREQLRRSLTQRAREFADDFDLEISRTYLALQVSPDAVTSRNWTPFADALDRWRQTSRFPRMVRDLYLAELQNGAYVLRRYDDRGRAFGESPIVSWPAHLDPVRKQLAGSTTRSGGIGAGKAQFIAITMTPVMANVPALLVPVSGPLPPAPHAAQAAGAAPIAAARFEIRGAVLVVDLDPDYLRQTVVPALAARHFPEHGSEDYRVAILSASGNAVFERGVPPGSTLDPDHADVTTSFFMPRLDMAREFAGRNATVAFRAETSGSTPDQTSSLVGGRVSVFVQQRSPDEPEAGTRAASPRGPGSKSNPSGSPGSDALYIAGLRLGTGLLDTQTKPGIFPDQIRIVRPAWRVVLQHASGSLDAAVTQARRRNLALSFGILAILAVGIALVVRNARRSEELAARQMDFVASVTHELRTPLAVIRSAAQNLSAGVVSDPAQARRYGDLVEAEGRRLTDTIEQVLEYAGSVRQSAAAVGTIAECRRPGHRGGGVAAACHRVGPMHDRARRPGRRPPDTAWCRVMSRRCAA